MVIQFDPAKRDATLRERGLDMAKGGEILDGEHKTFEDTRKDYGEIRNITVGFLDDRMVVMVWTLRDEAIRIISLRKANEREQALYHSGP